MQKNKFGKKTTKKIKFMEKMNSSYELVKSLSAAMVNVPDTDNVSTNRKLWDTYAREWNKKSQSPSSSSSSSSSTLWLQTMSEAVGISSLDNLTVLGNEWSDSKSLDEVLQQWLLPLIDTVTRRIQTKDETGVPVPLVNSNLDIQGKEKACSSTDLTNGIANHTLSVDAFITSSQSSIHSSDASSSLSLLTSSSSLTIAEIGSGGGRISKGIIPYGYQYHCFDISQEMLKQCQRTIIQEYGNMVNQNKLKYYLLDTVDGEVYWPCIETTDKGYKQRFMKKNTTTNNSINKDSQTLFVFDIIAANSTTSSSSPSSSATTTTISGNTATPPPSPLSLLPIEPLTSTTNLPKYDIIICFDVLVHCDMHAIYTTLRAIRLMLQPYGKAFISTSNILTPLGWQRFVQQRKSSPAGFIWNSPEAVDTLVKKCGLRIVRKSWPPSSASEEKNGEEEGLRNNVYYDRDYLLELEIL